MKIFTIDLHQIELRFENLRIFNQENIRSLLGSIAIHGQLEPLTVIEDIEKKYILIDGYQRYSVLKILEKDQAVVTIEDVDEVNALISLLRKDNGRRKWSIIEEAGVLQYLKNRLELSLETIATMLGRSKSFVKRRIDLIENLPESTLELIMTGVISIWSANRVIIPLARANPHNVNKLITYLEKFPTTSKQLKSFYETYIKSSKVVRNNMLGRPELFFKVVDLPAKTPEEKWIRDAKIVCGILSRLVEQVDLVIFPQQDRDIKKAATKRFKRIALLFKDLQGKMEEKSEYKKRIIEKSNIGNGGKRGFAERNCKSTEDFPKYSPEIDQIPEQQHK